MVVGIRGLVWGVLFFRGFVFVFINGEIFTSDLVVLKSVVYIIKLFWS